MFCNYSDKKSIDSLVAKKKQLQKQLISGRRYVDPNDDPTVWAELNQFYNNIACLKDTLENAESAKQFLALTEDGLKCLKQINRKIHQIYCIIEENILDQESVWSNMRQIKNLTTEFFEAAKQFKFNCLELFDLTGYGGDMQWNLSSSCCHLDGIIDWQRPIILDNLSNNQVVTSENIQNIYFWRNSETLEYYIHPEFNDTNQDVLGFSEDKDVMLTQIENNHQIVNQDYLKLVRHCGDVGIMMQKIIIRKDIIKKKLCNLEESVNNKNSIDVDNIRHQIKCIDNQLEIARKVYVDNCCQ